MGGREPSWVRPLQSAVWELMLVLTRTETEGQEKRVLETNLRELMILVSGGGQRGRERRGEGDGQLLDVTKLVFKALSEMDTGGPLCPGEE